MLEDFKRDMERCARCSMCKFVPLGQIRSQEYAEVCPSIARYNFHTYSGGGKLISALALLKGRIGYSDKLLEIVYRCQTCGGCDIACKYGRDMEVLEPLYELRIKCVENGQLLPQFMVLIQGLRDEDNMMQQLKADRGQWSEGLAVKNITREKASVYFHAGCRYSYDKELWKGVRIAIQLLQKAGVDVGIAGNDEVCCGCRAYEIGYAGEARKYAEHNMELLKQSEVKTIVTSCAECYYGFKVLYPKSCQSDQNIKVLHITEYLAQLVNEGKLKLKNPVPMTVTYHDPCHLGRLGEPYIRWQGEEKKVRGQMIVHDPPKEFRRGTNGVYQPPRSLLRDIPALKFVEMDRRMAYAWCCGAGGGVIDAFPDFAGWTARERIIEAKVTGAQAIITACPWCQRNFTDVIRQTNDSLKVIDITELLAMAI
jgi:Fe-S oxidoreductase